MTSLYHCYRYLLSLPFFLVGAQDIRLDSLDNGPGILPFNLGATKIISHFHTFLQDIDLGKIESHVNTVKAQLADATYKLSHRDSTLFNYQIKHLYAKLDRVLMQLDTFRPTRIKRGLINPIGTIIKSISGNLDNDDALKFENALHVLNRNDLTLSQSFNKHITLYKEMTIQQNQIISNLSINQRKLEKALTYVMNMTNNDNERIIHYAHLVQLFAILTENVQELLSEINRIENVLAFSRNKSVHHSILSVTDLKNMISQLKRIYNSDEIIEVDIRNYYEILSLASFFTESAVVVVVKFPITFSTEYQLYELCPVPNKNSLIIVPSAPYIASNSQDFVYIEAECPKVNSWHLCEQKIVHQIISKPDCIQKLIQSQEIDATCKTTPISLTKEALIELDSYHYIITFPNSTKVKLSCGKERYQMLQGSFLVTVPQGCKIKTPELSIINLDNKLAGQPLELMALPHYELLAKTRSFNLKTTDLGSLRKIQNQISMQDEIQVESLDTIGIYHTTIPFYALILFGAGALSVLYIIRRHRRAAKLNITTQTNTELTEEDRRAATFGVKVTK